MMLQRVQVLIVDHEAHTRKGLQALLSVWPQIEVVGLAANGAEAVRLVEQRRPDVALMDIPLPVPGLPAREGRPESGSAGMDGLDAIRLVKRRWPQIRIVVLAMYTARRSAALAAGADAFLLKGGPAEELLEAITRERRSR